MADNPIGYGKTYAAVLAGAAATVFIFLWNSFLPGHTIPAGMDGTFQTLFVGAIVYLTPHGGQQ
jgi:hypothetical protein